MKESVVSRKGNGVIVLHNFTARQPVTINMSNLANVGVSSRNLLDQKLHPKHLTNTNSLKALVGPVPTMHLRDEIGAKNKTKIAHKQKGSFAYTRSIFKDKGTPRKISVNKIILKKSSRILESVPLDRSKKSENVTHDLQLPLPSSQILKLLYGELTDYEKSELLDFDEVYYMGNGLARFNFERTRTFDDENDDYNTYVGEHLGYRYEILDILGKGSFGQVLKCTDHKTKDTVALKVIQSKKRLYKQASVEVKLLKYVKDRDVGNGSHVVKLLDSFVFRGHVVWFGIRIVHCICTACYCSLLVHQGKGLFRYRHTIYKEDSGSVIADVENIEGALDSSLRLEARKHSPGKPREPRNKADRLRQQLLCARADLHLHSEPLLPRPRDYAGRCVHHGHRHVESWLHPRRAGHGVSSLPGKDRARPNVPVHRNPWPASHPIAQGNIEGKIRWRHERKCFLKQTIICCRKRTCPHEKRRVSCWRRWSSLRIACSLTFCRSAWCGIPRKDCLQARACDTLGSP
eukprot:TRINITY_DN2798_c0_g1_i7.p1 TRINITY_DN2798_c0_g1~~TRINITY_DN2798_c0_g1_i7.p1  ORF type:complete len:517 (+),score=-1.28 TRINITY_DN2798_c0_g1_i7:390-1940(+)